MRNPTWAICIAAMTALLLCACGGRKAPVGQLPEVGPHGSNQVQQTMSLDEAQAELQALAVPVWVDKALFTQLKEALREALASSAGSVGETLPAHRITSKPPSGEGNRIDDLAIVDNGDGTYTLTWSYRNTGDYDQSGMVEIADISPLAVHFGEEADESNEWIDGSGDGTINIQDITAIAANLLREVASYAVLASEEQEGEPSMVETVAFSSAGGEGRKRFELTLPLNPGDWIRVQPVDAVGEPGAESNVVQVPIPPGQGDWWMYMHDAAHTGRSSIVGAQNGAVKWKFCAEPPIGSTYGIAGTPVIDSKGRVYFSSDNDVLYALDADGMPLWEHHLGYSPAIPMVGTDGTIYVATSNAGPTLCAISPDGFLRWESQEVGNLYASPVMNSDGFIIVYSSEGVLSKLDVDGNLIWSIQVGTSNMSEYSSPAIGPSGEIYVGSRDHNLYAVSPSGSVMWMFETGYEIGDAPSIASDGAIYIASRDTYVYALSPDGSLDWQYPTSFGVNFTPAIAADGTVYINSGYSISALTSSGDLKWRFDCKEEFRSDPTIGGDGTVYFGDYSGMFYALSPAGELKWFYDTGAPIRGNASIGPDGTVYVGNNDGWLFAFQTANESFSISGQVLGTDGAGLPDVYITASPSGKSSRTDADGYYLLSAMQPGSYTVRASKNGYVFTPGEQIVTVDVMDTGNGDFAQVLPAGRGDWWTYGRDQRHQHLSPYIGPQTATLKWEYRDPIGFFSPPVLDADGTIYFQTTGSSGETFMCAINPDGTLKWKARNEDGDNTAPALGGNGTVYASIRSKVLAFSCDGTRKWDFTSPGSWGDIAVSPNGTIYYQARYAGLYALNSFGMQKWYYPIGNIAPTSPAIGDNGDIYVSGRSTTSNPSAYAFNVEGELLWEYQTSGTYIPGVVVSNNSTLYISDHSKSLYSLNSDGSLAWEYTFPINKIPWTSCSLGPDGSVYLITRDGTLFAMDSEGHFKWSKFVGVDQYSPIYNPPAVGADGVLYLGSMDTNIYAINPDGTTKWVYEANMRSTYGGQAIAEDGTLYVTMDYKLFAFAD
jgi:outer membrane protein assembly factor BamB